MIDRVMTIGELSRRTGIPSSTLRYWEKEKVLPKPMRVSGQRRYSSEAADLVAVLQLAQSWIVCFDVLVKQNALYYLRSQSSFSK